MPNRAALAPADMLPRFNNRTKVFVPGLLFVTLIWALAAAWSYFERAETMATQEVVLSQLNSAIAEHADGLLRLTELSLKAADQWMTARAGQDSPDADEVRRLADDLRRRTGGTVDLLTISPDDIIETIPPTPNGHAASAAGRDYLTAQRAAAREDQQRLFVGAPILGRKTGDWTIPVTLTPSGTADGRFLIAAIRIGRLAALHERQRMKPGGAVTIARDDGVILSRAPFDVGVMSTSLADAENFRGMWRRDERGVYVAPNPITDGIPRLVSFVKLQDYPVFVSISARMMDVLQPWKRRMAIAFCVAAALTLITAGITAYLLRVINKFDQSAQRFFDVAATASDLVWELAPDLRFTFISNRFRQVLGLDEAQIIGYSPAELGWRPIDSATAATYANAVDKREGFADLLYVRETEGAPRKIVSISGKPFFDDGRFAGFRGAATDVTERIRRDEERQAQTLRQAHAGKMEALGQLAGGIAHDFNNLLGAILGFAQFLEHDAPPGSPQRRYAERIVTASRRGRGLVQQILAFSRSSPGAFEDVRVAELAQETCDLLRATLPASIELATRFDDVGLTVAADRDQLGQVLLNLCINAADALNDGVGHIVIQAEEADRDRPELRRLPVCAVKPTPQTTTVWRDECADWIATGGLTASDNVSITVSDNGSGIARQHQEPLFDLFFTTKAKGGGTGIGLPVVQRIVAEHGGAVLVKTRTGVGTAFEVILPRSTPAIVIDGDGVSGPAETSPPSARLRKAILVIDDDPDFCDMIQTALERLGHDAASSRDPVEGLAAVEENPDLWDMVVTDQTMPGMKGLELVRNVKRVNPKIRCVICTGYSVEVGENEAVAAGADAFCMKPIDLERFNQTIEKVFSS